MIKLSLRFLCEYIDQREIERRLFPNGDGGVRELRCSINRNQFGVERRCYIVKFGESSDSDARKLWENTIKEFRRLYELFPDEWKGRVKLVLQVAVYQEDSLVELAFPAGMLAAISSLDCALDLDVYFC